MGAAEKRYPRIRGRSLVYCKNQRGTFVARGSRVIKAYANDIPHVTVRPHVTKETTSDIHVAHVGETNGVFNYRDAFAGIGNTLSKYKYEEVKWYCNVKQAFQYEDAEIKDLFKRSGWKQ